MQYNFLLRFQFEKVTRYVFYAKGRIFKEEYNVQNKLKDVSFNIFLHA